MLRKAVYATAKRSCLSSRRHRLIVRGSSGIAPLATALDVKYAGCHTPRRPRPQWFDLLNIGLGVISRAAVGVAIVGRSVASLPSSLRVYYTIKRTNCQYLF